MDQTQNEVPLEDRRRTVPAWTGSSLDDDWRETVRALVECAFKSLRGQS